jgi:hypothetical protein
MKAHLYGVRNAEIEKISAALAARLGITWTRRDSSYRGDYFYYKVPGREEFILQKNWDPLEGQPMEPDFRDCSLLLYVGSDRADDIRAEIEAASSDIVFLRDKH